MLSYGVVYFHLPLIGPLEIPQRFTNFVFRIAQFLAKRVNVLPAIFAIPLELVTELLKNACAAVVVVIVSPFRLIPKAGGPSAALPASPSHRFHYRPCRLGIVNSE